MKNTLIKLLGGVTQADHDARMSALEHRLHIVKMRVSGRDRTIKYLIDSLAQIADCETPGSNATVRRMARIAAAAVVTVPLDVEGVDRG